MRDDGAMLSQPPAPVGPSKCAILHNKELRLFREPSGRLFVSPNRAAIPKGRDDEGAVKRYLDWAVLGSRAGMFRVLFFSFRTLLTVVCLLPRVLSPPPLKPLPTITSPRTNPSAKKLRTSRKTTFGKIPRARLSNPAERFISMSTSRSSTSPSPTPSIVWSPASNPIISACLKTASSRKWSPSPPKMSHLHRRHL